MVQGPGLRQWTSSHLLILTNVARPIQVFVELDADGDGAVDPHSRNHDTKDFYSLEIINFEPRRSSSNNVHELFPNLWPELRKTDAPHTTSGKSSQKGAAVVLGLRHKPGHGSDSQQGHRLWHDHVEQIRSDVVSSQKASDLLAAA